MDDPWGSPWADETPHPLPKTDGLGSNGPVTLGNTLGLNETSRSPWNDDDDFGEWAALPTADDLQASVQDGPEEAETVEWVGSVNEGTAHEKDHIRPDGSTWFSRELQPPNQDISALEISQNIGRGLSPDPRAMQTTKLENEGRATEALEAIPGGTSRNNNVDEYHALDGISALADEENINAQYNNEFEKSSYPPNVKEHSTPKSLINPDQGVSGSVLDDNTTDLQTEEVAHGESLASRSSSSPSDHSHHDEVLAESPRTSFEDEEKRPNVEKEVSSKVKETVRLIDGLATEDAVTELVGQSEDHGGHDDHFDTPVAGRSEDDFNDFEEGASNVTTAAGPINEVPKEEPESPLDKAVTDGTSDLPVNTGGSEIISTDHPVKSRDPVTFESDLSFVSCVFEQVLGKEFKHADPKQAPEIDSVIQDSFSSTEERKIWYRISRYGTMREHNSGDEDYVRVNWKDSKVRAATLKIVERWIEEDRIGGGAILGGGTRLETMFGWGQKNAAPIIVTAALASKSTKAVTYPDHTAFSMGRNSNITPFHDTRSNHNSFEQVSATKKSIQSPSSATALQFSWSSATPISTTVGATSPIPLPSVSSNTYQQPFSHMPPSSQEPKGFQSRNPQMFNSTPASIALSSAQKPRLTSSAPTRSLDHSRNQNVPEALPKGLHSKIDDDWGEMVSSPAISTSSVEDLKTPRVMNTPNPGLAIIPPFVKSNRATDSSFTKGMIVPRLDGSQDHTRILPTTSPATSKPDVWEAADFSFFESPAPPRPTAAPPPSVPKTTIPSAAFATQSSVNPGTGTEQDRIVKSIVQSLPDLSYMLRR